VAIGLALPIGFDCKFRVMRFSKLWARGHRRVRR
jgi:hypothetical protein